MIVYSQVPLCLARIVFEHLRMESSIVDTMRRYFENDAGKTKGDLEYTIINSVKRYFEGKPPER